METLEVRRGQYKVSDFVAWQRDNSLILNPDFQRRSVWKKTHKSFLIDTLLRGLPVPIIFLRSKASSVESLLPNREVVDGQQRIRTLLAYIAPNTLSDFDPARDQFVIEKAHNEDLKGLGFAQLPRDLRERLLDYEFSVHTFPAQTGDKLVLQMFARMNSSGYVLNAQELRNAQYAGAFKTLAYTLATEQLDRWRKWQIFDSEGIARMHEVELISEFMILVAHGVMSTSRKAINDFYGKYEDAFDKGPEVGRRIRKTFEIIDDSFSSTDMKSLFSRRTMFYALFASVYGICFGLLAPVPVNKTAPKLGRGSALNFGAAAKAQVLKAATRIKDKDDVPEAIAQGLRGATTDVGRRRKLIGFLAGPYDPCQETL